jgi:glycerophosphoryl diester phosphodiesterase
MKEYFFERVRPIIEKALREVDRKDWPIITLNLDLKSEEPEHLLAIAQLLTEYRDWITTAQKTSQIDEVAPLDVKPILVLTGESDAQKAVFYDGVPSGSRVLVFGATRTVSNNPTAPPSEIAPDPPDNYHRWWNNPWRVVEPAGQSNAGAWTKEKDSRLRELVQSAHKRGIWIRFYTLDGVSKADESCRGIFHLYNFGSREAVEIRWKAAAQAGVDYIASDQYEDLARVLRGVR